MVLTFDQEKELENLKHKHKKELLAEQLAYMEEEHRLKMIRLNKLLEIAKQGGKIDSHD